MVEINKVADYIIASLHEAGEEISQMKLQKLLYFAQGLWLSDCGEPLFDEPMMAWQHGPVSRSTYDRFKQFQQHDIDDSEIQKPNDLSGEISAHLDMIIETLGALPAIELRRMTHTTTPWVEVWEQTKGETSPGDPISQESMRTFFSQVEDEIISSMCRRIEIEDANESQKKDLTLNQVKSMRESA